MYIDIVPNRKSPPAVLLRESMREQGKMRKHTLANLSSLSAVQIEFLRRILRGDTLVCAQDVFETVRWRPHGHVAAVLGTVRRLGMESLIGSRPSRERDPAVAVEVFDANTGDPVTLPSQVRKIRERFGLRRVVLVGDRGMITSARIREDLKGVQGMEWITALRGPAIRKLVGEGSLQFSLFDQRDLAEIHSPAYPGERLIVCKNPLLADERRRKRAELLAATECELTRVATATSRARNPLRDSAKIGLRAGRVLGRFKMAKHFRLEITDTSFRFERNQARIEQEAALDGIYVIRTSVPPEVLTAESAVRSYKRLAGVERAFRSLKTVDLQVRPIYHRKADRVRAHILLCTLAYYVEWHMRRALAPILFDDHDKEAGEKLRASVVAPARRSTAGELKAWTKRSEENEPIGSLQSLLVHLATIVKNRNRAKAMEGSDFETITTPTPHQQRAFDLLKVSYRLS